MNTEEYRNVRDVCVLVVEGVGEFQVSDGFRKNETCRPFIKELITQVRTACDCKHPREPFNVPQFLISRKVFFSKSI